jgi:hypothetical protein
MRAGARAAYFVRGIVQNGARKILFAAARELLERPKYAYARYIGGFWARRYFSASIGDALSNRSAIPM